MKRKLSPAAKKRLLTRARETEYDDMKNPLMLFLVKVSVEMATAAQYGRDNEMTLEESKAKTQELMAKIQESFDEINQHLDSIEQSNDQIEANLEYAEMILSGQNRTKH